MIVACRLSNGIDIGSGVVLKGNYVGPEYPARPLPPNPPRERIAGFEITRDVPSDVWERWLRGGGETIVRAGVAFGTNDEQELTEWCWAHRQGHAHAHGAPRDGSSSPSIGGAR